MDRLDRVEKILEKIAKSQAESDQQRAKDKAEADRRLAENDRLISDLGKNIRGIGRSIGEITEAITVSGKIIEVVNKFAGINVDAFLPNLEKTYKFDPKLALEGDNRRQFEIDGLAVGKSEAVVIEAKAKLNKGDVDGFIKGLDRFKKAFDEYDDRDVYACVAFVRANDKTLAYAEKRGLFVIKATPPDVTLINSKGFKPKKFA